jgi:hypothetical protein
MADKETNKRGLYKFEVDYGRMGVISGVFIADKKEVDLLIGKRIFLGDALGKHSDVDLEVEAEYITLITDDSNVITIISNKGRNKNIAGYNPLDYLG